MVSVSSDLTLRDVSGLLSGESERLQQYWVHNVIVDTRGSRPLLLVLCDRPNIVKAYAFDDDRESWQCESSCDLAEFPISFCQSSHELFIYGEDDSLYRITSVSPLAVEYSSQPEYNYSDVAAIDANTMIGCHHGNYSALDADGLYNVRCPVLHLFRPTGEVICDLTDKCYGYKFKAPQRIASQNGVVVLLDHYGIEIHHAVCLTVLGRTVTFKWLSGKLRFTNSIVISSGVVFVSCCYPSSITILDIDSGSTLRQIAMSSPCPEFAVGLCVHRNELFVGCGYGQVMQLQIHGKA
jgi:hypothetical protein